MLSRRVLLLTLLPLILANSGCIFFHGYTKGQPISTAELEKINLGESNKIMVENRLGLPDQIIPLSNGTVYHYEYTKKNTFWLLILGHTSEQDDKLYMIFDERGILTEKKYQDKTRDLGWRLWPFGR